MDADFYEKVLPGYLDVLPDKFQETQRRVQISETFSPQADIYAFLNAKMGKSSSDRASGYYHPSEVATKFYCPYVAMASRLKKPAVYNKTPATSLILDIGHYLHKMIQSYLKDIYGAACQVEVPLSCEELHVAGNCDAIITMEDGTKHVIEIKTKANTRGMAAAVPEHVMQCTVYEFMAGASFGTVLYLDKMTNLLHGFTHAFDLSVWDAFVDKVMVLEATLMNNRLPTPAPHRYCSECSSRDDCPTYQEKTQSRMGVDVYE